MANGGCFAGRLPPKQTGMTTAPSRKRDRRRHGRAQPAVDVQGVDLTSGFTVKLRDFSARSFAVESPDPMSEPKVREFEFPLGLGRIAFKGIPKRRAKLASPKGESRYLVAFEFTWKTPSGRLAIEQFVRSIRDQVA
jgi:hypothetical protein